MFLWVGCVIGEVEQKVLEKIAEGKESFGVRFEVN